MGLDELGDLFREELAWHVVWSIMERQERREEDGSSGGELLNGLLGNGMDMYKSNPTRYHNRELR